MSIQVKFIGTVLIKPLGAGIFSSISAVLRQPLGVWVYISRTISILPLGVCIEIATGLMSLYFQGIMPLGVYIEAPTGCMGLYFYGLY